MGMGTHLFYWEKFLDAVGSQSLTDPHLILSHFSYLILSKNPSAMCYQSLVKWRQVFVFILETLLSALGSCVVPAEVDSQLATPGKFPGVILSEYSRK